ncbi:hypothetical protein EX895_001539 [Sporisorium graminicola]|uniref:Tc1-like transposase DDE domain-containing protein n=1 Tax=Sporisorium graminicola TaxID=280036 RepID=A0A4U7KY26_9BASI|nr:hypothetical protein EX895_001539 [Sporisorium graminicola]TKY89754.1 hypothetical protein EX895_001539 [Sporisorium graminicola]
MPRPKKRSQHINSQQPEKIIKMVFSEGMTKAEVAESLRYPYSTEHERYNNTKTIENRKMWTHWFRTQGRSFEDAIFFDEAGFNLHSKRTYDLSKVGDRAQQEGRPANRQKNMSLLVAVGKDGIIASEVLLGAYNTDRFCSFLDNKVLPLVAGQRRVFMMDNASFHRFFDTKQRITNAGHEAHYLPAYSPWLNITEKIQQGQARTVLVAAWF